jgi:peptide/nickel transport system substrate-binding protein
MRKLFIIIALIIAAIGLAACGGSSGSTPKQNAQASAEGNTPKPGGTLTMVFNPYSFSEPIGWNIHTASSVSAGWWLNPVQEYLMQGDFLHKGPRGTDEHAYTLGQPEWPENLIIGWILESWEWSDEPLGLSLKVKKGIKWQPNAAMNMAERDVTAEDVAFWINSYRSSPKYDKMVSFTAENCAEVTGEDTVFVHFTQPYASWAFIFGYALYGNFYPPEQTKFEKTGWEQVTGTGPFAVKNFTTGVGATYVPNRNWHMGSTVIDGKTYQAPFVETLNLPILGDMSTALSALITGQVDIMTGIPVDQRETLKAAAPDLNMLASLTGSSVCLVFNTLTGPMSNRDFRRALMIGTDEDALTALVEGSIKGGFPIGAGLGESVYTPIDKLPESVKELYGYNPEKAARMIKDLGFAGETVVLSYTNNLQADHISIAETLGDQWTKLGVNVQLNLVDSAVIASYDVGDGTNWEGIFIKNSGGAKPYRGIENERIKKYLPGYNDKYFNDRMDQMMAESDPVKRDAMVKEDAVYFMSNVEEFGLIEYSQLACWWPWVKNYYGETDSGGSSNMGIIAAYTWIDQDLKASMGF